MEQYFVGRKAMNISDVQTGENKKIENVFFANQRVDKNWNKSHIEINHSTFAKMGFLGSKFEQCDFSFCIFIDCYFKKAVFDQIKFLSCIFINCNFDLATFINCDFRYALFNDCFIKYEQMKKNLPHSEENLCADICRNLSMQCLKLGAIDDYKSYLFEERAAGETHSLRKLFHKGNSYYSKYTLIEGIEGFFEFLISKLSKLIWGYGEHIGALLRNIVIIIALYGFWYYFHGCGIELVDLSQSSILSSLYLSACTFFSASFDSTAGSYLIQIVKLSERIIGLVLMGFFGAALFRQINRR